MKNFLEQTRRKAIKKKKKIIFPEWQDDRVLEALKIICKKGIAIPLLLGDTGKISLALKREKIPFSKVIMVDPKKIDKQYIDAYANTLYKLRKKKKMTLQRAKALTKDLNYLGCLMIKSGDADGMVSGATTPTPDTLRPAIMILKKKGKYVSSFFVMKHLGQFFLFADCAVNINPDAKQLSKIAVQTADSFEHFFKKKARVALLSFSTKGSTKHPLTEKVKIAASLAKKLEPRLLVDGELQADAALKPDICKRKAGKSIIGRANVLIFPDLQSANISYKLVEWLGNYEAIGPILQGLEKPVNDLSRGCTVKDIVDVCAITAVQACEME